MLRRLFEAPLADHLQQFKSLGMVVTRRFHPFDD